MNHGKTTSAKMSSGQRSVMTERDYHTLKRIILKNCNTAAQMAAQLNVLEY
jgi:hypothetical protein